MIADWNLLPPGAVGGTDATAASPAADADAGMEAAAAVAGLASEAEMRRKGWPGMRRKEAQSSQSFFQTPFCFGWSGGVWGLCVVYVYVSGRP